MTPLLQSIKYVSFFYYYLRSHCQLEIWITLAVITNRDQQMAVSVPCSAQRKYVQTSVCLPGTDLAQTC